MKHHALHHEYHGVGLETGRYMVVDQDATGRCTLCGVHTARPHGHPQYEESCWFPPMSLTTSSKERTR